eukprot:389879-Alexandrium_andersonii.AAC.1
MTRPSPPPADNMELVQLASSSVLLRCSVRMTPSQALSVQEHSSMMCLWVFSALIMLRLLETVLFRPRRCTKYNISADPESQTHSSQRSSCRCSQPVSYTHLTLPTICSV